MKKLLSTSAILLSATVLVACSNNQSATKDSSEKPKTEQKNTTSTNTKAKVDNSKYDNLISEIKSKLDPESTGAISVKIQNNVINSDSSEPHDTIMILLTGTAKDNAKETMAAINSNSATTNRKIFKTKRFYPCWRTHRKLKNSPIFANRPPLSTVYCAKTGEIEE